VGARKWEKDKGVNWQSLKALSNRIQYHLRGRLAVAKVPGCPVLGQARDLVRAGYVLKLSVQTPWEYQLQEAADPSAPAGKRGSTADEQID